MFLNRNLHSRILVELEELDKVTFKSILVINAIEIHQKECNIVDNTKRMGTRWNICADMGLCKSGLCKYGSGVNLGLCKFVSGVNVGSL